MATCTTRILASNIHCSSCVAHIDDALRGPAVLQVSVHLATDEVVVRHLEHITTQYLAQSLIDEGFAVYDAVTTNHSLNGQVVAHVTEFDGHESCITNKSWYTRAARRIFRIPDEQAEKHVANCAACQSHAPSASRKSRFSRNMGSGVTRRSTSAGTSIEHARQSIHSTPQTSRSGRSVDTTTSPQHGLADGPIGRDPATCSSGSRWNLTLTIGGMTCGSCSSAITKAIQEMEGVESVKVDLLSNSCAVLYTGNMDYSKEVQETIEDIGYEAEVTELKELFIPKEPSANELYHAKLSIGGMTCASCTNHVTNGLKAIPYVEDVVVTLMTNSADVDFRGRSNLDKLVEEVEDLGFECTAESCDAKRDTSDAPLDRQVSIKVAGMFCDQCPKRVSDALGEKFGPSITITAQPDLRSGVASLKYLPRLPELSIRSIASTIEAIDPNFKASIYHPPSIEERSKRMQAHERSRIIQRLVISLAGAIPTFLIGVLWMDLDKTSHLHDYFMMPVWAGNVTRAEWALFFIATPVYFFAADLFHRRALKEIKALWRPGSRTPLLRRFYRFGSMNLLISAGTTVAYVASIALLVIDAVGSNRTSGNASYFDSVVFLTFFILIGRAIEAFSKSKTNDAVSMLANLKPGQAILATSNRASEAGSVSTDTQHTKTNTVIDADLLEVGDLVIVPHGSSPPADGVIVAGDGKFDMSSLTGESRPVTKAIGDEVFAGTIAVGDPVTIQVTKLGGSSMLDQIVSVVRDGLGKRAPVERYADVLTGYFVPVITAIAIVTWLVWLVLGVSGALDTKYLAGQSGGWAFWSLDFAIAVFVTACPCGIGLAAPTALVAGIGIAAKLGLLVQGGGEAFQEAPRLDAIVFDKTGTLTEGGQLTVADHHIFEEDETRTKAVWAMIHALEEQSSHPLAKAISDFAANKPQTNLEATAINEEAGRGLRGTFSNTDSTTIYEAAIGSQSLITNLDDTLLRNNTTATHLLSTWQNQARSTVIFAFRSTAWPSLEPSPWRIAALFATSDPVRPSAAPTIAALQKRGIKVFMLSGDNAITASTVGRSLGIPQANIFSGVLPVEKAEKIKFLQRTLLSKSQKPTSASSSSSSSPDIATSASTATCRDESTTSVKAPAAAHVRSLAANPLNSFATKLDRTAPVSSDPVCQPNNDDPELGLQRRDGPPDPPAANASVAFVGDGINDAPALLASNLSISLSTGAPIAMSSSSVILLASDLGLIVDLLDLSRKVYRRIKINFAWALVYNVVLVPVAAGVLFRVSSDGWRLGPVWASVAMAASSVSVVLSSLFLRWEGEWRFRGRMRKQS
jgi:heavy metal translocating P-type ATPase